MSEIYQLPDNNGSNGMNIPFSIPIGGFGGGDMRRHMGSSNVTMRDSYHEGYRQGYRHGWEDNEEDMSEDYRRHRDSRGRYV